MPKATTINKAIGYSVATLTIFMGLYCLTFAPNAFYIGIASICFLLASYRYYHTYKMNKPDSTLLHEIEQIGQDGLKTNEEL